MSSGNSDEPEGRRKLTSSASGSGSSGGSRSGAWPPLKRQTSAPMPWSAVLAPDEKKADTAMLQVENQKLSQQLEQQREQLHELHTRLRHLGERQAKYDENLVAVNQAWTQLVEDLEILSVKANASLNGAHKPPSCHLQDHEEAHSSKTADLFLDRLLRACPVPALSPREGKEDEEENKGNGEGEVKGSEGEEEKQGNKDVKGNDEEKCADMNEGKPAVDDRKGGDTKWQNKNKKEKRDAEAEARRTRDTLEKALAARSAHTAKLLSCVVAGVEQQRRRNDILALSLKDGTPNHQIAELLERNSLALREELQAVHVCAGEFEARLQALAAEASALRLVRSKQQSDIRSLTDQLEEVQLQFDAARRKLASLRQQQQQHEERQQPQQHPQQQQQEQQQQKQEAKEEQEQHKASNKANGPGAPLMSESMANGNNNSNSNGNGVLEVSEADRLREIIAEARAVAEARLAELEAKHTQQLELTRRLREREVAVQEETEIQATRAYGLLKEQLEASRAQAERYRQMIEQLQAGRDEAVVRDKDMQLRVDAGEAARRSCAVADVAANELEVKLQHAARERDAMQRCVDDLQAAAGRSDTVAGLKLTISTMHEDMNALRQQLREQRDKADAAHPVHACNAVLQGALLRKTEENSELQQQCAAFEEERRRWQMEVEAMLHMEGELRLFVQMLARESQAPRHISDARAAEARALAREEALRWEADEQRLAVRVRTANDAEAACQQRLAGKESEIAALQQQLEDKDRRAAEVEGMLKARAEEGDMYTTEIETMAQAYEDMQAQNRRLVQQIMERDAYNTQLMADSVRAKQQQASLKAEREAMGAHMQRSAAMSDILRHRAAHLEEQVKADAEQVGRVQEEARQLKEANRVAKQRAEEMERAAKAEKAAAESAREDVQRRERKVVEVQIEVEEERFKRKGAEEEKDILVRKLARANSESKGAMTQEQLQQQQQQQLQVEMLREEVNEYKSILKCSVCHDRQKEVVITKCFHLFCAPCIQRNLELRHRKCPGCGVPFGQSDVRTVYI